MRRMCHRKENIVSSIRPIMSSVILVVVAFFFTALSLHAQEQNLSNHAISNELQRILQEEKLAGAVWSIVDSNGQILTGAAGFNNLATQAPMRPHNRVHVGSITKTVVSLGVLRLVTQKKVRLDDTVENILPTIRFQNPWQATNPVTVRHLLDHRAGLEDLRLWQFFSENVRPTTPLEEAFTRDTSVLRVYAQPGTVFSYSNIGYGVLGMVIEAVSGMKYETFLDAEILSPLGMLNSTTKFISQTGVNADSTLAMGHLENGERAPACPIHLRSAAQMTTTAHDIAVMMRFLMSDGSLNGQEFIAHDLLQQMGKQRESLAAKRGLEIGYSLGLGTRDRNGVMARFHAGAIVGYNAMMQMFPEAKCAFFVSHNMDSETAQYERSNQLLLSHLPAPKVQPLVETRSTSDIAAFEGYYTRIFTKYTMLGILDEMTTVVHARIEATGATLEPFQGKTKIMKYLGSGLFQMQDRVRASHAFYQAENGDYLITESNVTYKKTSLLKIIALWASLIAGILGILLVLCLGILHLVKYRSFSPKAPILPAFGAICFFIIPIILVAYLPYTQWGDVTAASVSLCVATILLPSGSTASLLRLWQMRKENIGSKAILITTFFSLMMILQMCAVLGTNGIFPLMLWK